MNINRAIRAREIRLIGAENEPLGVVPLQDALTMAEAQQLDLVEVSPTAVPPVCRIMDFGKFKYQQSKKLQEAKKKQVQVQLKEIKLRPNTDEHDLLVKIRNARRFLEEGNKAKVTVIFRGREITHIEVGQANMDRFRDEVQDVAVIEVPPRMEGRGMYMIIAPKPKK